MSGALSAYTMKKQGLSLALIDKDKIGHGRTSANTGLLPDSNAIMLHGGSNPLAWLLKIGR